MPGLGEAQWVWPRWATMWCVAWGIYGLLKLLSWRAGRRAAPCGRHLAYLIAWPGMDAAAFLAQAPRGIPRWGDWLFAALKTVLGIALLGAAVWGIEEDYAAVGAWVGLVGVTFLLHFGLFHLLSCLWRTVGWRAAPIMNWPIAAENLADFWGRRWNLAFRDLTHQFIFVPLRHRWGTRKALLAGFFVSGLIHDVVISVPAGGGWGRPTLYFLLQGFALLGQHSRWSRSVGFDRGRLGRLLTAAALLLPLPLLLHPPFMDRVMTPFLLALGGWDAF